MLFTEQEAQSPPRARTIMISEIFGPTIQGEGAFIGKPTVFVRTGGCDYRCAWCDSLYAVLPEHKSEWRPLSAEHIFAEIQHLSENRPLLVTLSGGNPALQPLEGLIELGHAHGYTFAVETQGSVTPSWFAMVDYLTFSPKPPSSQQVTRWERLDRCLALSSGRVQTCFKIVVFDEHDYHYAKSLFERYPAIPMYLQAGNHTPPHLSAQIDTEGILQRLNWLIEHTLADRWYGVTVLPQLHTLLWGNTRGV